MISKALPIESAEFEVAIERMWHKIFRLLLCFLIAHLVFSQIYLTAVQLNYMQCGLILL
jgi:uncharacterized membrane protein YhhN